MKWLVTLLTLVAFAAVPTLAQAKPTPSVSNQYSDIPYLSHGVGVDETNFGGSASSSAYQYRLGAEEIPYLSHGVGVDQESLGATVAASKVVSPDDRALPVSTPKPTPIVLTKSDGWSVDFVNPGFAALALMIGLLAGGTVALMWGRRGRLTPA